jgi:aspartate/methionine/tyrosine aminotransferase
LPTTIALDSIDLRYPPAPGIDELRAAIAAYYQHFYGASITAEHVAVFAGGRPAIYATLAFLHSDILVVVERTEYTPYYDMLQRLGRRHVLVASGPENRFAPELDEYDAATRRADPKAPRAFVLKSNPCNPTGVTWRGERLRSLVAWCSQPDRGGLIDEAYELIADPPPASALEFVTDIDATNLFVVGAATKGWQAPGIRVGWVVAARRHIEIFRNFSSIAMGGVSRASQKYVVELLRRERAEQVRRAIGEFYSAQRRRYATGLANLACELFTGDGGFYHWARLPGSLTADEFNARLFAENAAILPGRLCDMQRGAGGSTLDHFIRFSFGPLEPGSYEADMAILKRALADRKA